MRKNKDEIEDTEEIDYSKISVQKLYRPVLYEKIPDVPPKDKDHPDFKWWIEQFKRCWYGWIAPDGHYLNGYLYFYLNFCTIPIRVEGTERFEREPPLYRDNDEDVLNQLWANTPRRLPNGKKYNGKNHVEAKPRAIAWSTYTLLGVGVWTFVFKNDAQVGCAYPNKEQVDTEREWFKDSWYGLHPMFKRWKDHELIMLQDSTKLFAIGYMSGKHKQVVNKIRFDVIGQDKKAGVYKGKRVNLMIAVEAGLWVGESLRLYYTANEPCIKSGDEQWGMLLVGGTSDMIVNKSTTYREMFEDPTSWNATRHFTPKTRVLFGCIDYHTGKSDEVAALKVVNRIRESKEGDPATYLRETIENPLTWQEAFLANDKSAEYNTAAINSQIAWIRNNNADQWHRGTIDPIYDIYNKPTGKYKFNENADGDWYINHEGYPNYNYKNLHVAGIDDRYKDADPDRKITSETSWNCMIIYRRPTTESIKSDMPVAMYYGNAPNMVVAYEEFYKGMMFYDITKSLYEYNSEGFISFLREKKALGRLFYIAGKPGLHISNHHQKQELSFLGHKYFTAGRHKNITLPKILEELAKWGSGKNTDIASAYHLVLRILEDVNSLDVTQREEEIEPEHAIIQLGPSRESEKVKPGSYPIIRLGREVA